MSEEFKIEIVNPEKSFLTKEDVTEVVVPAFEGEMGILKDHISIISFLKPGIITIQSKSGEEKFYVEDGIVEFKDNNLSVLTSSIFSLKEIEKNKLQELIKSAEEESNQSDISDQSKYLADQKIEVLKQLINNFFNFFFKFFVNMKLKINNNSVIISKSIHFHSKNSGLSVFKFISLSLPKNLITNHFCFWPLYLPFHIIPNKCFGSS